MTDHPRLLDRPDWLYLLRDYYELYRRLSAGGSAKIRTHQKNVRESINRVIKANAEVRELEPVSKPVSAHLRRALDNGRMERHAPFIRALESVQQHFVWQYGYEKVPRGLEQKYAYAELAGPTGPVITDEVILGLVLFAPGCTYPAHAHSGISESYICLSGAVSENDQGVYAPGSLIFNPPEQRHRITVADQNPALLCYAWTGEREKLANQKMVFSRGPKK
ncbi:dimethylsulfonioproprionate lyase family protein [Marivita sp. XM-24bin2]|uniref:dimethylsulfonioproprionate lyase family protein n=1 Tax=unclassified Marivita TaxID=2632480 RepID=UPI000D792116|nr:dimethylsulfonioproprionate lyase family protein [Marivita sp. XM-24bin2]MCR9109440.1 dimethylsulfoniopropionate lyase [Paracoccaceae bacterium]PWL35360.1 MAG: dimethlysulfonioproprionate lyase DddL [Marivita sp. XM-24bin2]